MVSKITSKLQEQDHILLTSTSPNRSNKVMPELVLSEASDLTSQQLKREKKNSTSLPVDDS